MTEEARKLADFIQDRSNNRREFIFSLQNVKEIAEIDRKIGRLLDELKSEGNIQKYERQSENRVSVIIEKNTQNNNTQNNNTQRNTKTLEKSSSQNAENMSDDMNQNYNGQCRLMHKHILEEFIKTRCGNYAENINIFETYSNFFEKLMENSNDESEEEIVKIFNVVLDKVDEINKEMRSYFRILQKSVENEEFSMSHLYNELYEMKDIQRRGWERCIKKGSIKIERAFLYENVVEHIYYAWLLGMLYLPEMISLDDKNYIVEDKEFDYRQYNKKRILDYLLIHDLVERYVGDILPEEKTMYNIGKEKDYMHEIFMHDAYQSIKENRDIVRMENYRKIWEQFNADHDNINRKIAREIDIIQAIYQFCVYKRMGAEFKGEKENEWREEKSKIETRIGVDILNEVVIKNFNDIFPESNPDIGK